MKKKNIFSILFFGFLGLGCLGVAGSIQAAGYNCYLHISGHKCVKILDYNGQYKT